MPAPPLGRLGLELGLIVFVILVEPFVIAVLEPHADLGFDRAVGQPQRFDLHQHIRAAQRADRHVARRLRLDRAFDVRPFQRQLTC